MPNIGPQELYCTLTEEEAFDYQPPRRTLCPEYKECFEYAAEQFWVSFTCRGCYTEELILAGKLEELTPAATTITFYFEHPACGTPVSLD